MIRQPGQMPNIYDEKVAIKRKFQVNVPALIGIVLLLLIVTRFVNLGMVWIFSKAETGNAPASTMYIHKFLSGHESAVATCFEEAKMPRRPGHEIDSVVVSYTDLTHPIIFVVYSGKTFNTIDLGPVIVTVGPGMHTFKISMTGSLEKFSGRTASGDGKISFLDHSLVLSLLRDKSTGSGVSFMVKPSKQTGYVHIPPIIYFFLPLVALLLLSGSFSKFVLTGFFYYIGLFLCFDTEKLISLVSLDTVMNAIGLSGRGIQVTLGVVMLQVIAVGLAILGLINRKNRQDAFKESLIVLYFIFLPLALRF